LNGRPFTRHGGLLTSSKGADCLTQILADIPHTHDGEWVPQLDTFFAFDLPDCKLDYDVRRSALAEIVNGATGGNATATSLATDFAHVRLVASYTADHFLHIYAGMKGAGKLFAFTSQKSCCLLLWQCVVSTLGHFLAWKSPQRGLSCLPPGGG